ncbi:MAG: hypothetical protein ABSH20_19680, partial [Tepidisphaeraceae bacterium]
MPRPDQEEIVTAAENGVGEAVSLAKLMCEKALEEKVETAAEARQPTEGDLFAEAVAQQHAQVIDVGLEGGEHWMPVYEARLERAQAGNVVEGQRIAKVRFLDLVVSDAVNSASAWNWSWHFLSRQPGIGGAEYQST